MNRAYCERYGLDAVRIAERVRAAGLAAPGSRASAATLQTDVIRPGLDRIIDRFYRGICLESRCVEIVREHSRLSKLKEAQARYLLSLGVGFDTPGYFEERLRIGAVHQHVGVSLSLYLCAHRLMQSLLIEHIPEPIRQSPATFEALIQFILRITTLDMSLAVETYHSGVVGSLEQSIDTIRIEDESLRRSLRMDSLTALYSRDHSIQTLERALTESRPISVIMADLDHFKRINDRYGHMIGDRVLQAVAKRLIAGARERDVVGRYGGEEFLFILSHTSLPEAVELAERIRQRVAADPIRIDGRDLRVTLSLGIAAARPGDETRTLLARADRALYAAKNSGRNRVVVDATTAGLVEAAG